jgi:hypothetical protein
VRLELTRAVLGHIGQASDAGQVPEEVADGLRAQYLGRLHWLETRTEDEDLEDEVAATAQAGQDMRRDLISFQRRELEDLRSQGRIGVTVLRTIEHDLDLEEARLSRT